MEKKLHYTLLQLIDIIKQLKVSKNLNLNLQTVYLQNQAISSSGNYRKFFIQDGVKYAHHIDPKTGYPAQNNLLSVSWLTCLGSTKQFK